MFYLVKSRLTKRKAIVTEINFKTTLPQKLNKAHLKKWYMVHMGNVDDEVKEYKHHNILAYGDETQLSKLAALLKSSDDAEDKEGPEKVKVGSSTAAGAEPPLHEKVKRLRTPNPLFLETADENEEKEPVKKKKKKTKDASDALDVQSFIMKELSRTAPQNVDLESSKEKVPGSGPERITVQADVHAEMDGTTSRVACDLKKPKNKKKKSKEEESNRYYILEEEVAAIESISGSQEDGKIQNVEGDPECGKPKKKKRKSKEEESKRCNNLEDEGAAVELNTGSQEHGIQNAEEDLDGGKSKKKKNKKKRLEKCRDDEKDGTISLPSDELALSGGDCPIDLDQIVAQMGNCGNDASGMIDLTKENVLTGSSNVTISQLFKMQLFTLACCQRIEEKLNKHIQHCADLIGATQPESDGSQDASSSLDLYSGYPEPFSQFLDYTHYALGVFLKTDRYAAIVANTKLTPSLFVTDSARALFGLKALSEGRLTLRDDPAKKAKALKSGEAQEKQQKALLDSNIVNAIETAYQVWAEMPYAKKNFEADVLKVLNVRRKISNLACSLKPPSLDDDLYSPGVAYFEDLAKSVCAIDTSDPGQQSNCSEEEEG